MKTRGFTLAELLIVLAILGLLFTIAAPAISGAWRTAKDRAALAHAHNVFKAAWAYLAEEPGRGVQVGDCTAGYVAGAFSVPNPGNTVRSCAVRTRGDGTPEVEVISQSGRAYRLP
ncbi:type II secretion system protein [Thermus tenuipuniceus]|uniref:type II secretion system protein n=1 Tax=Thermus tenuipuniceus TaxID=2078690 RepID=UPI000CF9DF43|nr:type II secretion system protein [Thermus tenuipuniceus]